MCKLINPTLDGVRVCANDLLTGKVAKEDYFNCLINGNFTSLPDHPRTLDYIDVCVSTICALCKESDLDFAENKIGDAGPDEQKQFFIRLGYYLDLPIRALSESLTRARDAFVRMRRPSEFQRMITCYWNRLKLPSFAYDNRAILVAYMCEALGAYRSWCIARKKPQLPWTLKMSDRGRRLLLHYSKWILDKDGTNLGKRIVKDYAVPVEITKGTFKYASRLFDPSLKR